MNNDLRINMKLSSSDTIKMKLEDNKSINANISGGIIEIDPIFTESPAYTITYDDINYWNNKSNFSGNYNDLTNKPNIPRQVSDLINDVGYITKTVNNLENYTLSSNLSLVATSGSYTDLLDKPTIPTDTSDLTNNAGFITNTVNDLTNYTLSSNLSLVATTGNYTDLSNTPTLANVATTGQYNDLLNKPTLSTVASTGDYDDLLDKPTIPTKTSDLQNDSGFITNANIPTKTSDLQNDSGFITNTVNDLTNYTLSSNLATVATSGSYTDLSNTPNLATVATSGSYTDLSNTPTIPVVDTSVSTSSTNAIENKAITNYVDNINTYSTSEIKVGTWLNKPLYRKVFDLKNVPVGSSYNYSHGMSNIDTIFLGGESSIYGTSNNTVWPVNSYNGTVSSDFNKRVITTKITPTEIQMYIGEYITASVSMTVNVCIVSYYTKTTD